eukprot:COSAG02_NODE_1242_length_13682_cov_1219.312523_9_plen_150_part_00
MGKGDGFGPHLPWRDDSSHPPSLHLLMRASSYHAATDWLRCGRLFIYLCAICGDCVDSNLTKYVARGLPEDHSAWVCSSRRCLLRSTSRLPSDFFPPHFQLLDHASLSKQLDHVLLTTPLVTNRGRLSLAGPRRSLARLCLMPVGPPVH